MVDLRKYSIYELQAELSYIDYQEKQDGELTRRLQLYQDLILNEIERRLKQ